MLLLLADHPRAAGQGQQSSHPIDHDANISRLGRLDNGRSAVGATAGRPAGGFLRPMCVNRGISGKHSVLCDLIAADYRGVPAVKSVAAAGGGRQRGQLTIGTGGGARRRHFAAVGIEGNGVGGRYNLLLFPSSNEGNVAVHCGVEIISLAFMYISRSCLAIGSSSTIITFITGCHLFSSERLV